MISEHFLGIVHPLTYLRLTSDARLSNYGRYCYVHEAMWEQSEADYNGWGINGYEN